MALRSSIPLLASLAAAGLMFGISSAAAQSDILHFEISTLDKTIIPGEAAQFPVEITNQSDKTIQLYVARTESNLPDTVNWYSALCFGDMCYNKDLDAPPPATLAPGEHFHFELSVQGGYEPNSTARIKINFAPGLFGGGAEKEFVVRIQSAAGVGLEAARATAAFPNPATSTVSIPLPAVSSAQNVTLELCDITGSRITNLTDKVRTALAGAADKLDVDMSSHPNGRYFYRLMLNGRSITGPIVIAR